MHLCICVYLTMCKGIRVKAVEDIDIRWQAYNYYIFIGIYVYTQIYVYNKDRSHIPQRTHTHTHSFHLQKQI